MRQIININKVLKYAPLSKNINSNKNRIQILEEIAKEHKISVEELYKLFALYIARVLVFKVQEAVKQQRIGGKRMKDIYPPLSDKYNKQKGKNAGKFWVNTGYLIKNIRIYKKQGEWNIGYPRYSKHPKSGVRNADIIVWLEKGAKRNLPPRPLFTPILRNISKNIDRYFQHWIAIMFGK